MSTETKFGFLRHFPRHTFIVVSLLCSGFAHSAQHIFFDVSIRSEGSALLHAVIYENPRPKSNGIDVLAVHGLTERASQYEPLAGAIFEDAILRNKINRVVALDFIGHGSSGMPVSPDPVKFGDLLIEDNVDSLIQAILYLDSVDLAPEMLIGHSLGGIAIQAAQEALLSQGMNLRALGVKKAALIAPLPARGNTATQLLPPADPTPFIVVDETLGTYLYAPPAVTLLGLGGFNTLSGDLAHDTPDLAWWVANDYASPEPLNVALQVSGDFCSDPDAPDAIGLCRPFTRPGAFVAQQGTTLSVIGFSQDLLTPFIDQAPLYRYLTGKGSDGKDSLFVPVVADNAVHGMYISDPRAVAESLRAIMK